MRVLKSVQAWRLAAVAALVATAGCVDEKIVYRDGPSFAAPPTAAASFVGYDDQTAKLTVCGNCHVTQQGKWKSTKHADAWNTLDKSGSRQGLCEGCHTVSNLGNVATDTAVGWRSTKDKRYYDVQCESCHGSGLQHVGNPARGQMLASVKANVGLTNGCAECHAGTHHPFVEEWSKTRHATPNDHVFNATTGTPPVGEVAGGPRGACQSCHIGQKVLEAWGVTTNYTEKSAAINCSQDVNERCVGTSTALGTTCVVCHDPHGSANPRQLRFPVDSRDPDQNLCVKCHNRRGNPDFSGSRNEPHAPHGPLLLGSAGWWPPGLNFDETQGSHSSDRNPKLCAGCHLGKYNVSDKATGKFVITVTGHRFLAIPCVDANGAPTDSQGCTVSQKSFKSCAASGCHTEATARTAFVTAEADFKVLYDALDQQIATGRANGKIPATELAAGKVTTVRGALFNSALAKMPGSEAHNPFLVKALLRASLAQVQKDYGVPSPIPLPMLAPYDVLILKAPAQQVSSR